MSDEILQKEKERKKAWDLHCILKRTLLAENIPVQEKKKKTSMEVYTVPHVSKIFFIIRVARAQKVISNVFQFLHSFFHSTIHSQNIINW
jgi:ABC-type anion transport system duplicated permease subunit